MFNKIWERYFLKEMAKVFSLVLFSFYALYVLIDYSSRISTFRHLGLSYHELLSYYLFTFIQRLDILIPFALLIAAVRTLINLNVNNELVALLASGIKLKTILRPFIIIGIFFTLLILINTEILFPYATRGLRKIEEMHFFEETEGQNQTVQSVILEDQSSLIYQSFDSMHGLFFDVYWIHSINDLYRMKYLELENGPDGIIPIGKYVDHLVRNTSGQIVSQESFTTKPFPEIHFNTKNLMETLIPANDQSIIKLWKQLPENFTSLSDKGAKILTAFYRKLAMPLLCLLVIIAPAPFCLRFTRNLPVFFIYICSMFGLVSLYLMMNAALVIGQSQVIHPLWAIWLPVAFLGTIFGWNFAKLK